MKAKWSVLALYENAEARQFAVQFCDCLVQRFWGDYGFDLSWCDWAALEHPGSANAAARKVGEADLIIIAPSPGATIPWELRNWLESVLHDRGEREGVLVGLPAPGAEFSAEAAATQLYLRKLAHNVGMDFLTAVPESMPTRATESSEAYNQRATQVTSVLDSILRYCPVPPRAP